MIRVANETEEKALEEFRHMTEDLKKNDITLIRFLRARDLNLVKAEEMLRKSVQWREQHNISSYLRFTPNNAVKEDFVFHCSGYDNDGRPVVHVPMGRWNARTLIESGLKNDIIDYGYHIFEFIRNVIEESKADQSITIFDLEHLSFWKIGILEVMQTLHASFKSLTDYYPEHMWKIFVINSPWFFPYIMNFIKPLLSSHIQTKINVYNSDKSKWLPALREHIPKNSLPKHFITDDEN